MQLHLKFTGKEIWIPLDYQWMVQGILYNVLSENLSYRTSLHEMDYLAGDRDFRYFVFGRLQGRFKRGSAGLYFPEGFSLEVRSAHECFIQLLLDGMSSGSVHRLAQSEITVAEARLEDRHVTKAEIRIRMDSPVTVYSTKADGSTLFLDPFDLEFSRLLAANAAQKWVSIYHTDPPRRPWFLTPGRDGARQGGHPLQGLLRRQLAGLLSAPG